MSLLTYDCGSVENTVTAILDTSTGSMLISGTGDIDNYADGSAPWYSDQENITQVTINKGVTRIGTGSFYGCESLSYVSIPNTVTSFGANVFKECASLKTIKIPKSITDVGNYIFADSGIESVKFYGNPPSVGTDIFDNVTATCYIPEGNEEWDSLAKATVAGNGSTITWTEFDPKPSLLEYDELDYFWSKIKRYVDNSSSGGSSLPIIDDKTFIKYLAKVISDSNHTNTSTTLYVSNPEYFYVDDCFYVKKDSTHFFYGIVSAVNNNTGALTYSIPASDGGTFFSPDDGQVVLNYGNPMNGGVYLDWANDRVDLYKNHTVSIKRDYNIYDPILNINAWDSTTASIAEEDGVIDISGENNHGNLIGGDVSVVTDKILGRCFYFIGNSDKLLNLIETKNSVDIDESFTIGFGLFGYNGAFTNNPNFIDTRSETNPKNFFIAINNSSNHKIRFVTYINDGTATQYYYSNSELTEYTYYYIVVSFEKSSRTLSMYFNGVLDSKQILSEDYIEFNSDRLVFGNFYDAKSIRNFNGLISNVRVFNKVLTPEEVQVIYKQSLVTPYINSNMYEPILNLDADYSTTASIAVADGVRDVSGNHNNGQAYGGVSIVNDNTFGNVFDSDGTNDTYMYAGNIQLPTEATLHCKVKLRTYSDYSGLISWRDASHGIILTIRGSDGLAYIGDRKSDATWSLYSSSAIPLDTWVDLTGVFSKNGSTIYINGVKDTECSDTIVSTGLSPLYIIGRLQSNIVYDIPDGQITDIKIFNRALTAAEVYNVYQQSLNQEAFENPEKLISYDEINVHHFDNNSLVQDTIFRIGNLNGILGINDGRTGIFIGDENKYIKFDKVNGLRFSNPVISNPVISNGDFNGCLYITPNQTDYRNGIRINSFNNCSSVLLGGNDLSSDSGTSENSWVINNISGVFGFYKNGYNTSASQYLQITSNRRLLSNLMIQLGGMDKLHPKTVFQLDVSYQKSTSAAIDTKVYALSNVLSSGYLEFAVEGAAMNLNSWTNSNTGQHFLTTSSNRLACSTSVTIGNAFTFMCEIDTSTWTNNPALIVALTSTSNNNNAFRISTNTSRQVELTIYDSSGTATTYTFTNCVCDNNSSSRIGVSVNNTSATCMVNGVWETKTITARTSSTIVRISLGNYSGSYGAYCGHMAFPTLINKALSIKEMYNLLENFVLFNSNMATYSHSATNANNVQISKITDSDEHPFLFGTSFTNSTTNQAIHHACPSTTGSQCAFRGRMQLSAAGTQGRATLILGNSLATASANNARGELFLYGTGTAYLRFMAGDVTANRAITLVNGTADVTLTLPSATGTLALTSSNITGSSASCTGNAATSTKTAVTVATGGTHYGIATVPYGATSGTAYGITRLQTANSRNDAGLYFDANATSGNQRVILILGNATANTTAAGKNGQFQIYGTNTGYTMLIPGYNSTSTINVYLPSIAGYIPVSSDNTIRNILKVSSLPSSPNANTLYLVTS